MAGEQYALSRGYVEAVRLGYQHHLWRETLGYLVDPSIPLESSNLRIADVGAGTGIWLLELAKSVPASFQLVGFDISSSGFPEQTWLPENVSFHAVDALGEPPKELWATYDIVHVRLFLIVINGNDPTSLINHCMRLLKPGGFIQWEEYDPCAQQIITSKPSVSTKNLGLLLEYTKNQKPFGYVEFVFEILQIDPHTNVQPGVNYRWVAALPQILEKKGLVQVSVSRLHEHRWHTKMWMEMELVLAEEFARKLSNIKGTSGSGDQLRQLTKGVYTEVQQGGSIQKTLQVVIGRKPLEEAERPKLA